MTEQLFAENVAPNGIRTIRQTAQQNENRHDTQKNVHKERLSRSRTERYNVGQFLQNFHFIAISKNRIAQNQSVILRVLEVESLHML